MYVCSLCIYVCMYVCVYIYIYICVCVCVCVCVYVRMYVYMFVFILYTYACMYVCTYVRTYACSLCMYVRGGADKSFARPGRKQATATKLGNQHSPHEAQFTSALTFASHSKKVQKVVRPTRSPRQQNDLRVGRKMATLQLFFQSREQVVVRRGQIRRIGWVFKTLEARVGQFLLGCKCPVSWGIVVQEQDLPGDLPRRLSFKISFSCTSRDE